MPDHMKIPAFYAPSYAPPQVASLQRLAATAAVVGSSGMAEILAPAPLDPFLLDGLHSQRYVDAFLSGRGPLASSMGLPWTPQLRDAVLAMLGGQIASASSALKHGVAMNIAQGFHHAVFERGSSYCAINGLALLAKCMPDHRIFVIDCDEHGGNGTEEYADRLTNLYNVSIFGTRFGCRGGKRSWAFHVRDRPSGFFTYFDALRTTEALVDIHQPDLIVFQAGSDCHHRDPKSSLKLTLHELYARDFFVFQIAACRRIPIVFVVAGGYQPPARMARLNLSTLKAAHRTFFGRVAPGLNAAII